MTFNTNEIEGKIAYAIWEECGERYFSIDEFCEAHGFTYEQFTDFLQHGIDAMTAFRLMDKYYSNRENQGTIVEV